MNTILPSMPSTWRCNDFVTALTDLYCEFPAEYPRCLERRGRAVVLRIGPVPLTWLLLTPSRWSARTLHLPGGHGHGWSRVRCGRIQSTPRCGNTGRRSPARHPVFRESRTKRRRAHRVQPRGFRGANGTAGPHSCDLTGGPLHSPRSAQADSEAALTGSRDQIPTSFQRSRLKNLRSVSRKGWPKGFLKDGNHEQPVWLTSVARPKATLITQPTPATKPWTLRLPYFGTDP